MDVGSITNPKVEGGLALFFGPGHPANTQQIMTDSERIPSHLHNPKPATTASTARRAELIATTRALQVIHDLYQGKACAHVCMDSQYVAKAWGSWIPMWEEQGWPGDEHIKKKDSGYHGSVANFASREQPPKRSNKRLADEDLLRQLAAIRRLYGRAERKGTGAAHLYLIDRNANPANKGARIVLENAKAQEYASLTQSPIDSRHSSMRSPRGSMYALDLVGSPGGARPPSVMSKSSRSSIRGSSRDLLRNISTAEGRPSHRSGCASGRTGTRSAIKPTPAVEEAEEAGTDVALKKKAVEALVVRPRSIKSAASAMTALSESDDPSKPAVIIQQEPVVQAASLEVPKSHDVSTQRRGSDRLLAAAAASAAAVVADVTDGAASWSTGAKEVGNEAAIEKEQGEGSVAAALAAELETELEDSGVAVPEGPEDTPKEEDAVATPALDLEPQTSFSAVEAEFLVTATHARVEAVPPSGVMKTSVAPLPKMATDIVAKTVDVQKSPKTTRKSKAPVVATSSKGERPGRIINYNAHKRLSSQQATAVSDKTDAQAASDPSEVEANSSPLLAEADETSATSAISALVKSSKGAGQLTAAVLAARSTKAAARERWEDDDVASLEKTLRKQRSLPATRKKSAAVADRASVISSSSAKSRRFLSLGAFGRPTCLGAAREEEAWTSEQEKKARRKTMKWFKKGDVPPLPSFDGAIDDYDEVVNAAEAPTTKRTSGLVGRVSHRREPTEKSIFEDDDEDVEVDAASAVTSKAKKAEASKEPKTPKMLKEPKKPKEPFSFRRSVNKLMTME